MPFPPSDKSLGGVLKDTRERLDLVERRLAVGGSGSSTPYDAQPGMVMPFSGTTVPNGWLLCDGSLVSRTTYSKLFAVIGTTYGPGDGLTTFRLPDYKGRVLVGQDAAQTEFDVLGEVGGAKTHTLTIAEMPAHAHQYNAAGLNALNSQPSNWDDIVGAGATPLGVGPANPEDTAANAIRPRGGGAAHNNLQPYAVAKYIISTGDGVGGGSAATTSGGSGGVTPAGIISPFAGPTAPSGWLVCDGAAVSRAGFPALFAAIGTSWGAGDGLTTFNVPNMKGRVAAGLDASQTEFSFLGQKSGTKSETLTTAQIPSHTHVLTYGGNAMSNGALAGGNAVSGFVNWFLGNSSYNQHPANSVEVGPMREPGGGAHNNLPPYAVANYIISTGDSGTPTLPAILPVALWQEFTMAKPGGLRPLSGGYMVWDGPISGNLGATLSADKLTITLPAAGTYRILTHLGIGGSPGQGASTNMEIGGTGWPASLDFGNCGAAGVYVSHIEYVITTTGPQTLKEWATPGGMYDWTWVRIEKTEPFYPTSPALAVQQGSAALRDAIFGAPTNDTDRASLANRVVTWFNTDKGWHEVYYAVTGTAGLTVPGLRASNTPGWYPAAGSPLYLSLQRNASLSANGTWLAVPFDAVWTQRNFPFTVGGSQINVPFGGDYEVNASAVAQQTAANYLNLDVRKNGVTQKQQSGTQFPHTNAYSRADIVPFILGFTTGQYLDIAVQTSSAGTISGGTALVTIKYLGPPLV